VHSKDSDHRKKIFALVGERSKPRNLKVRVAVAPSNTPLQQGIFGRLGRVSSNPTTVGQLSDASDGVGELQVLPFESRTARTPFQNSSICTKENINKGTCTIKDCAAPVRPVRESEKADAGLDSPTGVRAVREMEIGEKLPNPQNEVPSVPMQEKLPYFTPGGTLVIPFDSPERYHWANDNRSIGWSNWQRVANCDDGTGGHCALGRLGQRRKTPLLGAAADGDVARRLGLSALDVRRHRLKLGTIGFADACKPWSAEEARLMSKVSDRQAARRIGRNYSAVCAKLRSLKVRGNVSPRFGAGPS